MGIVGHIINASQGYAFTLPPGWVRLDLESGLSQFVGAAALADPSIAQQCQSSTPEELQACLEQKATEVEQSFQALADSGAQLAIDLATVNKPFPTLVIILTTPDAFGVTPELLLSVGPSTLRGQGVTGRIRSGLVDVPAGTATYFYYTVPSSQVANAKGRDFYLVGPDTIYEVLVVAHKSDAGLPSDADAIIRAFEILP